MSLPWLKKNPTAKNHRLLQLEGALVVPETICWESGGKGRYGIEAWKQEPEDKQSTGHNEVETWQVST